MKVSRRVLSLFLVAALVFPLVLMAGSALAETERFVKSSGGSVHVWPEPKKVPGTALGKLKPGTVVTVTGKSGSFLKVECGDLVGWMDWRYVGKREVEPKADEEEITVKEVIFGGKIRGTAEDSIINIWPGMKNRGKNVMVIPVGATVDVAIKMSNGWALVSYNSPEKGLVEGFVQSKWIVAPEEGK